MLSKSFITTCPLSSCVHSNITSACCSSTTILSQTLRVHYSCKEQWECSVLISLRFSEPAISLLYFAVLCIPNPLGISWFQNPICVIVSFLSSGKNTKMPTVFISQTLRVNVFKRESSNGWKRYIERSGINNKQIGTQFSMPAINPSMKRCGVSSRRFVFSFNLSKLDSEHNGYHCHIVLKLIHDCRVS